RGGVERLAVVVFHVGLQVEDDRLVVRLLPRLCEAGRGVQVRSQADQRIEDALVRLPVLRRGRQVRIEGRDLGAEADLDASAQHRAPGGSARLGRGRGGRSGSSGGSRRGRGGRGCRGRGRFGGLGRLGGVGRPGRGL